MPKVCGTQQKWAEKKRRQAYIQCMNRMARMARMNPNVEMQKRFNRIVYYIGLEFDGRGVEKNESNTCVFPDQMYWMEHK